MDFVLKMKDCARFQAARSGGEGSWGGLISITNDEFHLQMMNLLLKLMDYALKMMNLAFKMMNWKRRRRPVRLKTASFY